MASKETTTDGDEKTELDLLLEALSGVQAKNGIAKLVDACRTRYLLATYLLEIRSREIDVLEAFTKERIAPGVLNAPYKVLITRYFDMRASRIVDGQPRDTIQSWTSYFRSVLLPHLLVWDAHVRQVLWLAGALPCESWERSEATLCEEWRSIDFPPLEPLQGSDRHQMPLFDAGKP